MAAEIETSMSVSLFICAGSYRPRWQLFLNWWLTRRPIYKPLYRAEVVCNDIMGQAEFLREAGFYLAAAMMLRANLESKVIRLSLRVEGEAKSPGKRTLGSHLDYLLRENIIDQDTRNITQTLWHDLSGIAHGGVTNASQVFGYLERMREVREKLIDAEAIHRGCLIAKGGAVC